MISIITPTHNNKYLKELEASILAQDFQDWEWVVLKNNGLKNTGLSSDPRIKEHYVDERGIGALKKMACNLASGDIIVEADHDDLLTKDCLSSIKRAFDENPTAGFVYSDNAKLTDNFTPYDKEQGWTHKHYNHEGKNLISMNSLPLTPGNMGYVWFMPDHVRAWRKSVYDSVGGHDETLKVCDDQDLMQRLWLVTEFVHIPRVLYLYRITGDNTWLQQNGELQEINKSLFRKRIYSLAERWADKQGLLKIDLCGGFNKPAGYLSVDLEGGDLTANLEEGIPLASGSVGVVRAHDALEHVKNQRLLMREVHRVLAPGGLLLSLTPSTDGRGAWQDPTHVSFWNQNSFWYYTRAEQAAFIRQPVLFRELMLETTFPNKYCELNNIPYVTAVLEKKVIS